MRNSEPKVTSIDDLPYLEDIDNRSSLPNNGLTLEQQNKVISRIRPSFQPSAYSGMSINSKNDSISGSKMQSRQNLVNTNKENNNFSAADNSAQKENIPNQAHFQAQAHVQSHSHALQEHFNMPIGSPSCLDVADHISKCPICSKFYNTDKTIYIIAIITLAIICILLLKKVLDV